MDGVVLDKVVRGLGSHAEERPGDRGHALVTDEDLDADGLGEEHLAVEREPLQDVEVGSLDRRGDRSSDAVAAVLLGFAVDKDRGSDVRTNASDRQRRRV